MKRAPIPKAVADDPVIADELPPEIDDTPPFASWRRIYIGVFVSQVIVVTILAILGEVAG